MIRRSSAVVPEREDVLAGAIAVAIISAGIVIGLIIGALR